MNELVYKIEEENKKLVLKEREFKFKILCEDLEKEC